jgi:hypothetical protein
MHHNTFNGYSIQLGSACDSRVLRGVEFHDNIVLNPVANGYGVQNMRIQGNNWNVRNTAPAYQMDYNVYAPSGNYYECTSNCGACTQRTDSDLASWKAGSGLDVHSIESACSFANLAGGDFHITPGSTCKSVSSTGGEVGAYGVTNCVGHLCGSSSVCGNGTVEMGEQCDGSNLNGQTCASQGFTSGTLSCSGTCSLNTSGCTTPPPAAPTTLAAIASSSGSVDLSWTDASSNESGFRIERKTGPTGTYAEIGTTGLNVRVYSDAAVSASTAYTYRVRAYNASGSSAYSNEASATTLAASSIECTNWQSAHPSWIWCDDFEDDASLATNYFDVSRNGGALGVTSADYYSGTHSLQFHYTQGQESAGWVWRSFGRNPVQQKTDPTTDFQEVWYRFYVKMQSGWTGNPQKLTRAVGFYASDWSEFFMAHIWQDNALGTAIDPVSCTSGANPVCTGYNDFAHMNWLGARNGTTQIYAPTEVGRWRCVESHIKLNTPGQANGIQEYWIDGNLEASRTDLNFRGSYTGYGINAIQLEGFWNNGAGASESKYYDNFVISRQRVGCATTSSGTNPSTVSNLRRMDTH